MRQRSPKSKIEILEIAIPLFAQAGFDGVSMRNLGKKVGLTAPTLYHHFPDKQTLYLEAIAHIFSRKTKELSIILDSDVSPEQRLKEFVFAFCHIVHDNPDFCKLLQRELLVATHLRLLDELIYHFFFPSLLSLCAELAPGFDAHLLAVSILGLVLFHYQTTPLRQHLPGSRPEHNDPEVVANHVSCLLFQEMKKKGKFHQKDQR